MIRLNDSSVSNTNKSMSDDAIRKYLELPGTIVKSEIVYPKFYTRAADEAPKCGMDRDKLISEQLTEYMEQNSISDKSERMKKYKEIAFEIYDKCMSLLRVCVLQMFESQMFVWARNMKSM